MNKKEFNGKNLEEAIEQAAKFFSVEKPFVCYNTVNKPQGGLLSKLFGRSVTIEAWVETAKEDLQEAARNAVREALGKQKPKKGKEKEREREISATPVSERQFIALTDKKTKDLLDTYNKLFFASFSIDSKDYSTKFQEENAIIHINDSFLESLLTKSDKLSLAYEHVFKRVAQKKIGEVSGRLILDAGASAEKREEHLAKVARSLAEKVIKTGKSIVLSSKSSQERRIIHLALDGFDGVGTRSIGTTDNRRLVIFSTEKKSQELAPKEKRAPKKARPNGKKHVKRSSSKGTSTPP